jgi:signal transduction histidine kinase/ligand-binding sensor domain-containing protein
MLLRGFAWLSLLCAVTAGAAPAAAPPPPQFQHIAWSTADGAPPDIWAMAQADDGYLWLGTGDNLYRFDGVQFEAFRDRDGHPLPASNLTALLWMPGNEMWLGYFEGGMAHVKDGKVTSYHQTDGLAEGWVSSIAVDHEGTIWASMQAGLVRFDGHRWQRVGDAEGFHGGHAGWVLVDPMGNLWVSGRDHLFVLRRGEHRFVQTAALLDANTRITRAPDGTLWLSDGDRRVRALPGLDAEHPDVATAPDSGREPAVHGSRLLFDSDGRLWGADPAEGGVFMVEHPEAVAAGTWLHPSQITERFGVATGMTSDQAGILLSDVEHNVWVGTNFGMDSFRRANVTVIPDVTANPERIYSMTVDATGQPWIVNGRTLYQWRDGKLVAHTEFPSRVFELNTDPEGALWFATDDRQYRLADGNITAWPMPPSSLPRTPRAKTSDGHGGLWIGFDLSGIYHLSNGTWQAWDPGIPHPGNVSAMDRAPDGTLWIGFSDDRIVSSDGRTRHVFTTAEGLHLGATLALDASKGDVIAGGEAGLAWNISGRFKSLQALGDLALAGISGIARDAQWIWLNTSKGVIRIAPAELRRAVDEPGYVPAFRLFDSRDGLPGIALQSVETSTINIDGAGRVWVATNKGLAYIDPAHIRDNPRPPPVLIRYLEANGERIVDTHSIALKPLTRQLQIAYTATSLSIPDRVRFRYRLDGVDTEWQEAGDRREAFYTNMKPGSYRFRVTAANEDGIWNEAGTSFTFRIEPAFYQTWWFSLACALFALLLVVAIVIARFRHYASELHARLEERHRERERIARDLHDTLLQSIHALVLRFQLAVDRLPRDEPARSDLEEAIERADDVIVEGRNRVAELRGPGESLSDLAPAIEKTGRQLAAMHGFAFELTQRGTPVLLQSLVAEECFAIVREALINAARHAAAKNVVVAVEFARAQLYLSVTDDGAGMEPALATRGREGHFGLAGMRERAARVGATFNLTTAPGQGTMITVYLPARLAFVRRPISP